MPIPFQNRSTRTATDYESDLNKLDIQRQDMRANEQTLQANSMAMREKQGQAAEQMRLKAVIDRLPPTATPQERIQAVRGAGGHVYADVMEKMVSEQRARESQAFKHEQDAKTVQMKRSHDMLSFGIKLLQLADTKEAFIQGVIDASPDMFDTPTKQKLIAGIPADKPWDAHRMEALKSMMEPKERLAADLAAAEAARRASEFDVRSKETAFGHDVQMRGQDITATTSAANTAATNVRMAEEGRLNRLSTERIARMPARAQAGEGKDDGVELNEQTVINAAARYNMDGTLPPNLGRGAQGTKNTAKILNEAARIAAERGDTPEAQRIAQVANKANSSALAQLQKQESMVGAFERNFTKNADLAVEMSGKADRTGVPIVNKWINAGKRAVTGDEDLARFDAVIKSVSNEFAKIVSGSMGNTAVALAEIKKIEALLNAAQTPGQVKAVVETMKRETANRMKGFEEEKAKLKESMIPEKKTEAKPRVKFDTLK